MTTSAPSATKNRGGRNSENRLISAPVRIDGNSAAGSSESVLAGPIANFGRRNDTHVSPILLAKKPPNSGVDRTGLTKLRVPRPFFRTDDACRGWRHDRHARGPFNKAK